MPSAPREQSGGEIDLRELCTNTKRLLGPTVVLDLVVGIGMGLAVVLKSGISVEKWILVESDMQVAKMAVSHADKLHERYPHQFCAATLEWSLLSGAGRGMRDERSRLFRELKRVLGLIKRMQGDVLYIVENVDMEGDVREQVQVAHKEVTATLGPGVVADGAQAGSRTH
ncbi:unnamed protein product [Closterium sp. Naga37s-1]|nr:unnamed protein product [Closterium sp. Naga37s-1]